MSFTVGFFFYQIGLIRIIFFLNFFLFGGVRYFQNFESGTPAMDYRSAVMS